MSSTPVSEQIWSTIQLVFNSLKFSTVGSSFAYKSYLEDKFRILGENKTKSINWSRCENLSIYHRRELLLNNLVDPLARASLKNVLVHPFAPEEVVEWLSEHSSLCTADISKDTLNWEAENCLSLLSKDESIDSVVFYTANGLCQEIADILKNIQEKIQRPITTFLVVDQSVVSVELAELLAGNLYTYCLWTVGESQVTKSMAGVGVQHEDLTQARWYAGWKVKPEGRIEVLQLSKSAISIEQRAFLEAYLYLLLEMNDHTLGIRGWGAKLVMPRFFFEHKINSTDQAQAVIGEAWLAVQELEIAPVFVSIASKARTNIDYQFLEKNGAKSIYDQLIKRLEKVEPGSLEVPALFTERTYTQYYFYSTESKYWEEYFHAKKLILQGFESSDRLDLKQHKNARFIERYGLKISLVEG